MGKTIAIVVIVVLVLSGFYILGLNVTSQRVLNGYDEYAVEPYASSSGPEWDQLQEYIEQGSEGWAGLEVMMASTDVYVAQEAARELSTSGLLAVDHFFKGLTTIDPSAKSYVGGGEFDDVVWQRAVEIIRNQEEELLEGAAYFLRLENSDMWATSLEEGDVGDILVASIPNATGTYADVLPMTLGFYIPDDVTALTGHLKSRVEHDRLLAVRSLGKLGIQETLADVQSLQTDSSQLVRTAAFTAENSINTAATTASTSYAYRDDSEPSAKFTADRENAKKRLGMP